MRIRWYIATMVLFFCLTGSSAWAQHHPGNFGMGLTVSGSTPGFMISYAPSHLVLEPTYSMQIQNKDYRNQRFFSPGIGALYQFRQDDDFRPHVGVRCGLDISRLVFAYPVVGIGIPPGFEQIERATYMDVFVSPVFGARYYLSDHFAVLGEFQVKATLYDQGAPGENYRGVGELSVTTSQFLAAYFCF